MGVKGQNRFVFLLFTALISGFIGLFIWLFLKLLSIGTDILWNWLPSQISFPGYTIFVCFIGGILLGLFQKQYGKWPQELETVMGTIKKEGSYPYQHIFMMSASALIPLLFGGSIGPEAGLTGVIAGLCFWAGENFKYAGNHIRVLTKASVNATLAAIFHAPLFGFFMPIEEEVMQDGGINRKADLEPELPKTMKVIIYLIAALCGFGTFFLLSKLFGGGLGMPKLTGKAVDGKDWAWIVLFLLVGILCGVIFEGLHKFTKRIYEPCSSGNRIFIATISGALLLGIAGTFAPIVMFSGEAEMELLAQEYIQFTPFALISIGILKLALTNICIQSGWRGGHFFPVIFAGVSIGYGVALLTGTEPVYAVSIVTASMLGYTMKKPIAVVLLLMLCFPVQYVIGMIVVSCAAALVGKKMEKLETDRRKLD